MDKVRLDTMIDRVLDSIEDRCKDETKLLSEINSVIRGDKLEYTPELPSLWIYTQTLVPTSDNTALKEQWVMPVVLEVVIEENNDAQKGYKKSTELAAKARSAVLKDRKLGLDNVAHVLSGEFHPSGPGLRENNYFSSMAVVNVRFFTFE